MADYQVGKGGSGSKDRYMVGFNQGKSSPYKVGGGGSAVGQADNKRLGGGDQDAVVGSKSAFSQEGDNESTYKDIGDQGENMNFGGSISSDGIGKDPTKDGGQVDLDYSIKGDWSDSKNAMARRKAGMDNARKYFGSNSQYDTPTVDLYDVKKP